MDNIVDTLLLHKLLLIGNTSETLAVDVGSATDVNMTNANNDFGTLSVISGNNVHLTENNTIDLGASNISGNFDITAEGNITNSGALQIAGIATFSAGDTITLMQLGNNFNRVAVTAAHNVSLLDTNAIDLGPINISGSLQVTANGAITQNGGGITVNGVNESATFAAGSANDITLNNAANDFTTVTITSGNNVSLRDVNALNLGAINAAGNLNITTNGDLSQTGGLVMTGLNKTVTFATGFTNNIILNNSLNSFANTVITNANNVTLFDMSAINLGTSSISGNLDVAATGAITQTGMLTVPGTSSFEAGENAITLTQNNIFGGSVLLSNSGNNNVAVTNSGLLTIGPTISSLGTGTLTLTGLGVTQSGAIDQDASAGAVTINAGAGIINLANSSNIFTGTVSLNNSGANNVQLTNGTGLILGTSNIGSGTLGFTVGGSITQTGAITQAANAGSVTFTLTMPSSDILLASAPNNFSGAITYAGDLTNIRDIARRNINSNDFITSPSFASMTNLRNLTFIFDNANINFGTAITLHNGGNLVVDTSGSLSGGTGGSITQTGILTVPGTSSFNAGSHVITLTQNNAFTGAVTLINTGNNNVAVTDSGALSMGASSLGSGILTLTGLGVSQTGAITQEANAGAVAINAGAGAITLASNNTFTGAVSLNNSGANNVQLTNSGALVLGTSTVGSGTFGLTAGGTISESGPLVQAANAGAITLAVTVPSSDILFASQPNNINGGVFFGGTLSNIRDVGRRNINANPGVVGTNLALLTNLRNVTIILDNANFFSQAVTLHNGGSLYVDTSGSLSGGTGGNITQLGAVTVPGTTTLIAGAHSITATQDNSFGGDVFLSNSGANDVSLRTSGALNLATSTIGRNLLTVAGGNITLKGVITAGNSIVLAGTGFTNNAGASALNPGTGSFQVWSGNPASDNRGGLVYNFKQYNATYGVTPVQGTGNGFLYTIAPVITPGLTGNVSKTYTGTTDATLTQANYTASGSIDGDTITFNPLIGTYGSANVGSNINVAVSGISIAGAANGSAVVYGYQLATTTANANIGTITPASLTVTANDLSKTYGQTLTFNGTEFTPTGLQNGETVGSVTLTSAGAVSTAAVLGSPYAIVPTNATGGTFTASNYSITYTNGALTINTAPLTVAANNASKTYGQTLTFNGTEFTPTGLQNGETVGSVTLTSAGAINTANVVGSPYSIVGSNATGGTFSPSNYSITYTNGVMTVNPATLTYVADLASRNVNTPNPALSGIITGFVNGESQATATTGTLAFTTPAIISSPAGLYQILGSGLTANLGNYHFVQAPGNATALTINGPTPVPPVPPVPSVPPVPFIPVVPPVDQLLITRGLIPGIIAVQPINGAVANNNGVSIIINEVNAPVNNITIEGTRLNRASSGGLNNALNGITNAGLNNFLNGVTNSGLHNISSVLSVNPGSNIMINSLNKYMYMLPSNRQINNQSYLKSNIQYYSQSNAQSNLSKWTSDFIIRSETLVINSEYNFLKILLVLLVIGIIGVLIRQIRKEGAAVRFAKSIELANRIISFKMRTTLNSIMGFADLLLYSREIGQISEKQKEHLKYIIFEANYLLSDCLKSESVSHIEIPLAVLSFKLRTVLNNIIGFTNIIYYESSSKHSAKQKKYLKGILIASNEMMKLVPANAKRSGGF